MKKSWEVWDTQTSFFPVYPHWKQEQIRRSPRGKRAGLLLDEISKSEAEKVADMAILLISKASGCITSRYKHKLPSAAQASMWSTFHQLRGNQEMKQAWGMFVSTHIPESSQQESELALQLLFDRLLKKMLHNKADAKKRSTANSQVRPLTAMESNAVRYMSGYVAESLLKKYRKPTKQPQLKVKRALFVRVLTGMKATWRTWVRVRLHKTVVWPDRSRWPIPHQRQGLWDSACVRRCVRVNLE